MSDWDAHVMDAYVDEARRRTEAERREREASARLALIRRRVAMIAKSLDELTSLPEGLHEITAETIRLHLSSATREMADYVAAFERPAPTTPVAPNLAQGGETP